MRGLAGWVVLKNLLLFLVTLATALPMHDTLWAFSGRDVRLARAGGVGASGGVMYGELYWMVVTPCNMLCGTPLVQPLVPSGADCGCVWRRPGIYSDLLAPYILVRPNRIPANPKTLRLTAVPGSGRRGGLGLSGAWRCGTWRTIRTSAGWRCSSSRPAGGWWRWRVLFLRRARVLMEQKKH